MLGDAFEHVAQVGLWVQAVELGRADQAVHGGCAFTAGIRASVQPVLASEGHSPDLALGGVVVDLDAAIVGVADQCIPPPARVDP